MVDYSTEDGNTQDNVDGEDSREGHCQGLSQAEQMCLSRH